MKTICAMQPYLFPYLPYFQLAKEVETFWVLDDVQFIRRGWMNRNRILLNGNPHQVTFPLAKAPRDALVCDMRLADQFQEAMGRLGRTVEHAYGSTIGYSRVKELLEPLKNPASDSFLDVTLHCLQACFDILGLSTKLRLSSELNLSTELRGQDRIVEICQSVNATRYVNPIGGQSLYDAEAFAEKGIELFFLKGALAPYPQVGCSEFQPGLSILDVFAHLKPNEISLMMDSYELVTKGNQPVCNEPRPPETCRVLS